MKVVLDTNVILSSLSFRLPYRLVLDKWEQGAYDICLTTDILLEYEEKIGEHFSPVVARGNIQAFLESDNSIFVHVYYKWNLI